MTTFGKPGTFIDGQIDQLPPVRRSGDIGVLSISPPIVSNMKQDLPEDEGVVGGINLTLMTSVSDELGMAIDPWSSMSLGDDWIIEATYLPGPTTTLKEGQVTDSQVGERIFTTVFPGRVLDGVCELRVGVRRVGGAGGDYERSAPLPVLIKTTLPGGPDPDSAKPYHQGLASIEVAKDILLNGVTKDYLDDEDNEGGVRVTIPAYLNMRKNDRIYVQWGDKEIDGPVVKEGEVGQAISFVIPADTLRLLPATNPLLLTYRLKDVVDNHSAAAAPPIFFKFDPNLDMLETPIVNESDIDGQIDLDLLKGEDVHVLVSTKKVRFGVGDNVNLRWRGVSAGGRQVPVDVNWKPDRASASHEFDILYYWVHLIARGFAKVDYQYTPKTGGQRDSRSAYVTMHGMALKLAAPEVREAKGSALPIDTDPAHIIVPRQPGAIIFGDIIFMHWRVMIADPDNPGEDILVHLYEASRQVSEGLVDRDVEFTVANDHIKDWIGAKVLVSYTVGRADTQDVGSETLVVQLGDIVSLLPEPQVGDAKDGVLIPENVPKGAVVIIKHYPGMRALDRVRLDFIGVTQAASFSITIDLTPEQVGLDLSGTVPFDILVPNRDNRVELVYTVTNRFTYAQRVSERLILNIGSPIPAPTLDAVKDAAGLVIERNSQTFTNKITLSGTAGVSVPVELRNNGSVITTIPSTDGRLWSHSIDPLAPGLSRFTVQNPGTTTPSTVYAFSVLESQTPIITEVRAGNTVIAPNGSTYQQSNFAIKGTATNGQTIDIYDDASKIGSATVTDGVWTLSGQTFGAARHSLTARTTNGSNLISQPHVFTVMQGLIQDLTNFHYLGFNGWGTGNAVHQRDLTFHFNHGQYVLNNYTYTMASAGLLLYKTFHNLEPFRTYTFTIAVARFDGRFAAPIFRLRTDQVVGPATYILNRYVHTLSLTFTPTTPTQTLYLDSLEASGVGNDWDMAWIQVLRQ